MEGGVTMTEEQRQEAIAACDRILETHARARKEILEGLSGLKDAIDQIIEKCKQPPNA